MDRDDRLARTKTGSVMSGRKKYVDAFVRECVFQKGEGEEYLGPHERSPYDFIFEKLRFIRQVVGGRVLEVHDESEGGRGVFLEIVELF